jgi:hypothetical protein
VLGFTNPEVLGFTDGPAPNCMSRSVLGLPEDKIVLCNFNQLYKIDPVILDVWSELLKSLPQCVLWLLRFPKNGETGIRRELRKRGVTEYQVVFTDVVGKQEHINRGVLADLFVDTLQCNAHTTACDILWSGTPLVTMPKTKMSCRVAASLLTALGCPNLVKDSLQAYKEFVYDLVANSSRELVGMGVWQTVGALASLRADIERKRLSAPLFDTRRWVQNLEVGIELMWQQHEDGKDPEHIKIPDVINGKCAPEPALSERVLAPLQGRDPDVDFAEEVLDKNKIENVGNTLLQLPLPAPPPASLPIASWTTAATLLGWNQGLAPGALVNSTENHVPMPMPFPLVPPPNHACPGVDLLRNPLLPKAATPHAGVPALSNLARGQLGFGGGGTASSIGSGLGKAGLGLQGAGGEAGGINSVASLDASVLGISPQSVVLPAGAWVGATYLPAAHLPLFSAAVLGAGGQDSPGLLSIGDTGVLQQQLGGGQNMVMPGSLMAGGASVAAGGASGGGGAIGGLAVPTQVLQGTYQQIYETPPAQILTTPAHMPQQTQEAISASASPVVLAVHAAHAGVKDRVGGLVMPSLMGEFLYVLCHH